MFKRNPRSYARIVTEMLYPRGGWRRAMSYYYHRLRRLPDPPERIARGVAAGVFISFTPLFGAHLLLGIGLALAIRGNAFAAAIGSLIGNPLTFPFIAMLCVGLGQAVLGTDGSMTPAAILGAFSGAGTEVWRNSFALLTGGETHWSRLEHFFDTVFLPYLVGGLVLGILAGLASHYMTVPMVRAFHRHRQKRRQRRAAAQALTDPASALPGLIADPGAPRPPGRD